MDIEETMKFILNVQARLEASAQGETVHVDMTLMDVPLKLPW